MEKKDRAPRNRTLLLEEAERDELAGKLSHGDAVLSEEGIRDRIFNDNLFDVIGNFPDKCADLIIIDPPYNLNKNFHGIKFSRSGDSEYERYLESWFPGVARLLKDKGSLYICGDWRSSPVLYQVLDRYLIIRNRITWQREKGRGAKSNWKNCTEDIWFATASRKYYFDVGSVMVRKRVIAPYRENGKPKGWQESGDGNFRLTHPSNFWDDITVPYWSMRENTDHPCQKPEKLGAKLILASCPEGGLVVDPFCGSGAFLVAAKKLGRHYCGIEINTDYCLWAQKRLDNAERNGDIQGYRGGVFIERNSLK